MKIIRISGCHECPYTAKNWFRDAYYCDKLKLSVIEIGVLTLYIRDKTLPNNCPLEDAFDFMVENAKNIVDKKLKNVK